MIPINIYIRLPKPNSMILKGYYAFIYHTNKKSYQFSLGVHGFIFHNA